MQAEDIRAWVQQYKFPLIIGGVGLIVLSYGLISLLTQQKNSDDIQLIPSLESEAAVKKDESSVETVLVDVAGAVTKPGVYSVKVGARVNDAIEAAGGMSDEADMEAISKKLNLAAKVQDGTKLYIPAEGEVSNLGSTSEASTGISENGLININTASQAELEDLPGIGPVTAEKIIGERPYTTIEELLEKKVVSNSVFEKIKEKVGVY